jgi:endonuclease/exonuclease/phosphatase family metal-dependent hydrolase
VLTFNIHHGEGMDRRIDLPRIARVIQSVQPDLVALQEVDRATGRSGGVDQLAELARLTEMHAAFGKAIDHQGGAYGVAILSRYEIESQKTHLLPSQPDREQRVALEVRPKLPAGPALVFVSLHLDHQLATERIAQVERIIEIFADETRPVILAGDFNARPESDELARLTAKWSLSDSQEKAFTCPAEAPAYKIDYVLYPAAAAWRVQSVRVVDDSKSSDHRPLIVELVIDTQQGELVPR